MRALRRQDLPRARAAFAAALARNPDCVEAHSRLAFSSLFDAEVPAQSRAAVHASWASRFAKPEQRSKPHHGKLRIAYLSTSSDGRPHSRLISPFSRHHDRERFVVYDYGSDGGDISRSTAGLDAAEIGAALAADEIDVLVDTDGHHQCRSMQVLASRPAPLLVSLGTYPLHRGITGVLHIAHPIAYDPPRFSPALRPEHPCAANGFVTFACFSEPLAIGPEWLGIFADIVSDAEGSRFVFLLPHGAEDPRTIESRLRRAFEQRSVDPGRVAVAGPLVEWDRLDLLNEVDILLDTQPFSDTAAALDALWMGVPCIACDGGEEPGRGAATVLRRCAMEDFVAMAAHGMRAAAVRLAQELQRRSALRLDIASQFRASGLVNHEAPCRSFELLITEAWDNISR